MSFFDNSAFTTDWLEPAGGGWRAFSVPEQIAARVGEQILVESLKPGEPITELALAHQFGVSRGPVREALRLLEKEGLVEITPRKGAQVTLLTPQEAIEIFDIRAVLLGYAARIIARKRGEGCLDLLRAGLAELVANFEGAKDVDLHLRTSVRMKLLICRHSENMRLFRLVGQLLRHTARYSRLSIASDEMKMRSIETWGELLRHIEAGDEDAAEALERRRVIAFEQKVVQMLNGGLSALPGQAGAA